MNFCFRLGVWVLLLHVLVGCDQLELPWKQAPAVKLTTEQIRTRIALQQEMADFKDRLKQVQTHIDQSREHLSDLRAAHKDKFHGDDIEVNGRAPLGSDQAMVAIVEFTDFQCPYCARHAAEVLPLLKRNYIDSGKLRYFIRDFPLANHTQARYAAVVALCAEEQGRYWQMHDVLFRNQKRLNPRLYLSLSRDIGLDPTRMSACLINPEAVKKVEADVLYGQSIGVSTTPKFFVGIVAAGRMTNVIMIKGARPYAEFSAAIELLLDLDTTTKDMRSALQEKIALTREVARVEAGLSAFE